MLEVNRDLKMKVDNWKNDKWGIIEKDEHIFMILIVYFISVFTKEDVNSVQIPQQMFQGRENGKLLNIIITKDIVQK